MSVLVGWQLLYRDMAQKVRNKQTEMDLDDLRVSVHTLAASTGTGLIIATVAGLVYLLQRDEQTRRMVFGSQGMLYLIVGAIGLIGQGMGWWRQWKIQQFSVVGLTFCSVGAGLALFAVSMIRECVRVRAIDLTSVAQRHTEAAAVGGFGVFVIAAVVVVLMMTWCIRLVQNGLVESADHEH